MTVWNALSFDVEDWFHIMDVPSTPKIGEWGGLESRVEANTRRIYAFLEEQKIHATFFFLGWVAERSPGLVAEAAERSHEVASHGYGHDLIYKLTREQFRADLQRAVHVLQEAGVRPVGYRAPGFSITSECLWALEEIRQAGFQYDTSLFPAPRIHGGFQGGEPRPHRLRLGEGRLLEEFPISTTTVFGRRIAFSGGGYLRLFPLSLLKRWIHRLNSQGVPVIVYLHPREIDPDHPRLPMPIGRRFRSYVGLRTVLPKLRGLLREFKFTTVRGALAESFSRSSVEIPLEVS